MPRFVAAAGDTAQALAFIARSSPTLTGSDATNYKALINGLVNTASTSGGSLFSRFDMLCIFAAPDSANALLNLINSTYAGSLAGGGPTFTTYRGFNGNGSTTGIDTNFNPFIATTPNFTVNSAHVSVWNLTNVAETTALADNAGSVTIYPNFSSSTMYARINDSPNTGGFVTANATGHILGNRDSSSSRQTYQNAASIGSYGTAPAAGAVDNAVLTAVRTGSADQNAMFSAGASLSATDTTNFYNLLRTYMTAVGVP